MIAKDPRVNSDDKVSTFMELTFWLVELDGKKQLNKLIYKILMVIKQGRKWNEPTGGDI